MNAQNSDLPFKGQNEEEISNPRIERPFGLSISAGGPTFLVSLSANYFVSSTVNFEAGIGVYGFYTGATYHFNGERNEKKWTPYTGAFLFIIPSILGEGAHPGLFIPLGMQFMNIGGFTFRAEVAGILSDFNDNVPVWGALKFGYHF